MLPNRLELVDVHAGYGRIEVLRNVSLKVPAGTTVALLGSNGAGKTTTLGAVAGTVPMRSGELLLNGRSIRRLSSYQRAMAGVILVPEGRGVFPSLSVHDNLQVMVQAVHGRSAADRAERLDEVLELFPRLRARNKQLAGTMSGGEQQMLALSRAFLAEPQVLLMDEISMGLAPQLVSTMYDAVRVLQRRGMTIVLVEQFLTYALRLAEICYVLSRGRISFVGEPAELQERSVDYLSA